MFEFAQPKYVTNMSEHFTLECQAFGVPLPTLYWIPGPLNVTSHIFGQPRPLVQHSSIQNLIDASSTFNSRFLNESFTFCPNRMAMNDSNEDSYNACNPQSQSANASRSTSCPIPNALCNSVPCGVDISTAVGVHADGRPLSITRITICSLSKSDEGALSCLAVNNISNVINTPEAVSANLIVQGNENSKIINIINTNNEYSIHGY